MKLLTEQIKARLLENGRQNAVHLADDGNTTDFPPVVKLFTPDAACTWLLSEIDPDNPDIAFGLCDLGMGCPELGSVSLTELTTLRGPMGLAVERDRYFKSVKPLTAYADEARACGYIKT